MRVGGHGISAKLRQSSNTLGEATERPSGTRSTFERVVINEMQEARLSTLQSDDRLSCLATHLVGRCCIQHDTWVRYGWLKGVKSIVIGNVEYQERRGNVMVFDRGAK